MEEKRLVVQENLNIFQKFCKFFRNLFGKKRERENLVTNIKEENLRDTFRKERSILEIQEKYEEGSLTEKDLTATQKKDLEKLYNSQIGTLEYRVSIYKRQLENYKNLIEEKRIKVQESQNNLY